MEPLGGITPNSPMQQVSKAAAVVALTAWVQMEIGCLWAMDGLLVAAAAKAGTCRGGMEEARSGCEGRGRKRGEGGGEVDVG